MVTGRGERGNVLLLVPAALLVTLLMFSLVIDAATLYLGSRQLADLAAAGAQDAVRALDPAAYYARGDIVVDRDAAQQRLAVIRDDAARHGIVTGVSCSLHTQPATAVVTCRGRVHPIVAPVWDAGDGAVEVSAIETATAVRD